MTTAPKLRVRLNGSGLFIVDPDGLVGPFTDFAALEAYRVSREKRRRGRRSRKPLHRRLIGSARLALVGMLAALAACSEDVSIQEAAVARITQERAAREIVASRLRDPLSAQFADFRTGEIDGIATVCGTVNARNAFGGYAGPERFIVGGDSAILASDVSAELFASLWLDACLPSGAVTTGAPS